MTTNTEYSFSGFFSGVLNMFGLGSSSCEYTEKVTKNLLKIFGNDYTEFKNNFVADSALISGSFLLQSFYETEWNASDIDIYVPYNDKKEHKSKLDTFLTSKSELLESTTNGVNQYYKTIAPNKLLFTVKKFKYNNTSIDMIFMNSSSEELRNKVYEIFDFDICKNSYDMNNNVHITSLDDVTNKRTKFMFSKFKVDNTSYNNYYGSFSRYYKYKERGITFTFDYTNDEKVLLVKAKNKISKEANCNYDDFINKFYDELIFKKEVKQEVKNT